MTFKKTATLDELVNASQQIDRAIESAERADGLPLCPLRFLHRERVRREAVDRVFDGTNPGWPLDDIVWLSGEIAGTPGLYDWPCRDGCGLPPGSQCAGRGRP